MQNALHPAWAQASNKTNMTMEQWDQKLSQVAIPKEDMNKLIMNFLVTEVSGAARGCAFLAPCSRIRQVPSCTGLHIFIGIRRGCARVRAGVRDVPHPGPGHHHGPHGGSQGGAARRRGRGYREGQRHEPRSASEQATCCCCRAASKTPFSRRRCTLSDAHNSLCRSLSRKRSSSSICSSSGL